MRTKMPPNPNIAAIFLLWVAILLECRDHGQCTASNWCSHRSGGGGCHRPRHAQRGGVLRGARVPQWGARAGA